MDREAASGRAETPRPPAAPRRARRLAISIAQALYSQPPFQYLADCSFSATILFSFATGRLPILLLLLSTRRVRVRVCCRLPILLFPPSRSPLLLARLSGAVESPRPRLGHGPPALISKPRLAQERGSQATTASVRQEAVSLSPACTCPAPELEPRAAWCRLQSADVPVGRGSPESRHPTRIPASNTRLCSRLPTFLSTQFLDHVNGFETLQVGVL